MARRFAIGLVCFVLAPGFALLRAEGRPSSHPPASSPHRNPRSSLRNAEAEQPPIYTEAVVVTASKVEQQIVNAPATVTVVIVRHHPELTHQQLRGAAARRCRG